MRKFNISKIKEDKYKAFTLVELIVVITILAILGTIGFLSYQGYTKDAKNSVIKYNITTINQATESKLASGIFLPELIKTDRTNINGINTGSTVGSGAYIINNLKYKVGYLNYVKLGVKKEQFLYENNKQKREFIFAYVVTPERENYEYAGNISDIAGNNQVIIKGKYFQKASIDTKGLISKNGDDIGLKDGEFITGSLY